MSTVRFTIYTCDRCRTKAEVEDGTPQPKGWIGLQWTYPCMATFEGTRHILCSGCALLFKKFLKHALTYVEAVALHGEKWADGLEYNPGEGKQNNDGMHR